MKSIGIKILFLFTALSLWSCADHTPLPDGDSGKRRIEKTVAVVLPMEGGLEDHWRRTLLLYSSSLTRAFKTQDTEVSLNFEYYDESTEDLGSLAETLGSREDVYAVIGGLYSSNSAILTTSLTRVGKTFFTLATSEEIVRAYASSGYLWAMAETDITQCEVLLSKVVNYGGKSVALLACGEDLYGKTFVDWFSFQARELGLENRGVFTYSGVSLPETVEEAMGSGAEYVICAPSGIEDIGPILAGASSPRLLFSDTAYGTDVISFYGEEAEGLEGVAFGADPESGFDVSYRTFFGLSPTTGEAQLYDAAMLIGYAAWYQHLHPDSSLQGALREIVSGEDLNMGSWTGEDMGLVIDALARGDSPYVRGASGALRFDKKIYTNVLSTTYYNYKIYGGDYIILDYNTSDGGKRTDATLAGWNWKASQMQDFEQSGGMAYPQLDGNRAILVATSKGWTNYRHQADVLAIYSRLKEFGYSDDDIILIAEDDLGFNPENPYRGVVRVTPGGPNVRENAVIDYYLSDLSPADFTAILLGERSDRLPCVLDSGENDNVFIFWSGHGVPGAMCWNDEEFGMTAPLLAGTIERMHAEGRFRKLLMMVEACYSGGVMQRCEGIPGTLFITATNGEETSKADIFSSEMRVWMSNRFTSTFIEQISQNPSIPVRDLYYRLFINTVGSHVMVYNAHNFGNIYSSDMAEFIKIR